MKRNIFKEILDTILFAPFFILFIWGVYSCTGLDKSWENLNKEDSISAQNFFDKKIRVNYIKDKKGHDLILYETGNRYSRYYSFSIEHSSECKLCYEIYD